MLALGIAVFCWPPGRRAPAARQSTEIALIVLATLWFSPVVWSYHLTAATPALALVISRDQDRWRLLSLLVAVVWLAALGLLCWPVARACGVLLWLSLWLGVALVGTYWQQQSNAGKRACGRCDSILGKSRGWARKTWAADSQTAHHHQGHRPRHAGEDRGGSELGELWWPGKFVPVILAVYCLRSRGCSGRSEFADT